MKIVDKREIIGFLKGALMNLNNLCVSIVAITQSIKMRRIALITGRKGLFQKIPQWTIS
ncbi:hypothetical protein [Tolypothrix sp. VBCCA 56010]|uniref:hypothetical protein n=1 Tax=Tolypothrix sp. VBCCA 56010 TaxID=3137731 RepID=UPI003D7E4EA9